MAPNTAHVVAGTGAPADASASDVVVNVTVPASVGGSSGNGVGAAVGVSVLANVTSDGAPFGGILTTVNFTTNTDPDGNALAVFQDLGPFVWGVHWGPLARTFSPALHPPRACRGPDCTIIAHIPHTFLAFTSYTAHADIALWDVLCSAHA